MKHKKKPVVWTDAKTRPPDQYVSKGYPGKTGSDIQLLVLVKGSPKVHFGIFRHIHEVDPKTKKVLVNSAYWHVQQSHDAEVVAWRPLPRIPEEYWEVTGYDKFTKTSKRPASR